MELVKTALEQQRFLYKHVATAVRQSMRDAQPVIISKITARKSIVCKGLLAFITRKNGARAARRGARINKTTPPLTGNAAPGSSVRNPIADAAPSPMSAQTPNDGPVLRGRPASAFCTSITGVSGPAAERILPRG